MFNYIKSFFKKPQVIPQPTNQLNIEQINKQYERMLSLCDKNEHLKDLVDLYDIFYKFHIEYGGQNTLTGQAFGLCYLYAIDLFFKRKKQYEDFERMKN